MATITITSDSLERLQGFLAGIEWTNDSAISVVSVDPEKPGAVLIDQDADEERHWLLGPFGLTVIEQQ